MSYDYLVFEDVTATQYLDQLAGLGKGLAISSPNGLHEFVQSRHVADIALVDLQWRRQDGEPNYDFDGLDVIAALEQSGQCRRVVIHTEGGPSRRHWIEEASRSPIVAGGILKGDVDLAAVVDRILNGERYWDVVPQVRTGQVVVDLLEKNDRGSKRFTAKGRLVAAMLEDPTYRKVKDLLMVKQQTIASLAPQLVDDLRRIGEKNVNGEPQPALAGWIGENRHYLVGWRRRVVAAIDDPFLKSRFGDEPLA